MYRSDVPRDVHAVVATIKAKRTTEFVNRSHTGVKRGINQPSTMASGEDLVKMLRAVYLIGNSTSVAESWKAGSDHMT